MNLTHSLFKQTRTTVHSAAARRREREKGFLSASHAAAAIQIGTQLLLWIFFYGYDRAEQTIWQAVLMLAIPLALLCFVWQNAAVDHPAAKWWMLSLNLCLLTDSLFLITALSGFISQLVPTYPSWAVVVFPVLICYLTALRARPQGVRYGSSVLIIPLVMFFVFGTVFSSASTRADRMWPILGNGLLSTAKSAVHGVGAIWGVALLFWHPGSRKAAGWAAASWALALLCAVWFGFLNPWSAGDHLAVTEKMMGLARHAHSVILYEMTGILWMLLIPAALSACFSFSGQVISCAFPRLPLWTALAPAAALPTLFVLIWPEYAFTILAWLLPWRYAVSLLCGLGLMILQRRQK